MIMHTFTTSGVHTIDFEVYQQGGGPFGLLYSGVVPEASTFLLLGTGLIGLMGFGWQRRKQDSVSNVS